jgi:hypothetical protein
LRAQAPDAPGNAPRPIVDVEISGLRRTKPQAARYPLEKFIGQDAGTLDPNEVQAAVKDTGVLECLAVEVAETAAGPVLRVTVAEKWSFFPVPLILAGSGGTSFGLFLADTNAFGLRDQAVLGGMYGSGGWTALALYNHTPHRRGPPGWNALFMYNRQERKDQNRDEETLRRYTADSLHVSAGLQYSLTELLSAAAALSFTRVTLAENDSPLNAPAGGAAHLGFSPGLSLRASGWDGYLFSQRSLSLRYTCYLALEGSSYHKAEFRGIFEQSLIPGFRLNLRSGAVWNSSADSLFESGPQEALVDILPRGFSALHYTGFSGGFEKYLVKTRQGTLSALFTWQAVFSRGPLGGDEVDHGPSGGIRFYLSRLAIPALGLNLAYNMNSGRPQFAFSLGMGF